MSISLSYSIVTGAASGLGEAIAAQLAKEDRHLILVDLNPQDLSRVESASKKSGQSVISISGDVGQPDTWEKVISVLKADNAKIELLANCAGVTSTGDVEAVSLETWHWVMNTNFFGTMNACHALVPFFKKQRSGKILNVASRAGISSVPQMAPYNASKAAIISLSETLYSELKTFGIGVTVACPSYFQSHLAEGMRAATDAQKKLATQFIETASRTAESMAEEILGAVRKNELYYFPSGEDKTLWRIKRAFPRFCLDLVTKKYLKELKKLDGSHEE